MGMQLPITQSITVLESPNFHVHLTPHHIISASDPLTVKFALNVRTVSESSCIPEAIYFWIERDGYG